MDRVSTPAALLLSVLVVCTTALVYKGLLPTHAFFTLAGVVIGYAVPRAAQAALGRRSSSSFPPAEVPTRPDIKITEKKDGK